MKRQHLEVASALVAVMVLSGCGGGAESPEAPTASDPPSTNAPKEEPSNSPNPEGPPEQDSPLQASLSLEDQARDCVSGVWEIEKFSDHWDVPFGDANEVAGVIFVYFDPVSWFMLEYDDVRIFTTILEETDHWVQVDWDGSTIGDYDVDDDGLVSLTVTDADITVTTNNHTARRSEEDEINVGVPIEMVYQCEDERPFD